MLQFSSVGSEPTSNKNPATETLNQEKENDRKGLDLTRTFSLISEACTQVKLFKSPTDERLIDLNDGRNDNSNSDAASEPGQLKADEERRAFRRMQTMNEESKTLMIEHDLMIKPLQYKGQTRLISMKQPEETKLPE